jgi:two-component system chemotaxis response regulator CheY
MRRILVVEDSASMRAFVRSALVSCKPLGELEVFEAASGFDALRLLPRGSWQLVITDINMPDINGLELISFMRKNEAHRDTPVLIISTASSARDRERGLALGASSYLVKPFSAEDLAQAALALCGPQPAEPHG